MESLNSACRVCLECKPEPNSLFDEVEYEEYVKLTNIFMKVTMVEVLETEAIKPTHICQECTDRMLSAYEFICSVERAEQEIGNYLMQELVGEEISPHHQVQCEDVDVEASDGELQGVEVLEVEFVTNTEVLDSNNDGNVVTDMDLVADNSTMSDELMSTIESREEKPATDLVGSRLSKRQSANYLKCNSCQRAFAKAETLERHIKIAHTVVATSSIQSSKSGVCDDKRIMCPYCPHYFKRRKNYVRHLITSHSKEADCLTEEDKELAKTKQNYKKGICPHCGESFTQASLVIHIRRHTGENPYQCDQCEKAFPRRQDLNIHIGQHTGEKPHACTVCGKSFSRANKLARHMRIHTGERPYKCTKCERCFTQSNDLKIHMRRHTGEKPYKCNVCSAAFICGAALKTHRRQKNHHSPEDEQHDPFANWRVCKRKMKAEVIADEIAESEQQEFLDEDYTFDEDIEEIDVKAE